MASSRYFVCRVSFCRTTVAVLLLGLLSGSAFAAKAPELSAIEVYPTGESQAYVQISGFTLNGKNEVHLCTAGQPINKNSYGKLPKLTLAPNWSIERAKDGVLLLSRGGAPECIVPANLKLEKAEGVTPSELADKTDLHGQVVGKSVGSAGTIPPLTPGVKIVLVSTLDTELAEFLLAQRSASIAGWKSFLGKYPSSQHTGEGKGTLAHLYVLNGQSQLAAYESSLKSGQPNYGELQAARAALESANALVPSSPEMDALATGINAETSNLNGKGQSEIALYRDALVKQVPGYSHLVAAETISQLTLGLDPKSPETASLSQACIQERTNLDHRFVGFDNNLSHSRPAEAYELIKPLLPFAGEYPRVHDCLHNLYSYYVEQGKKSAANNDLQGEVTAFEKASEIDPNPQIAEMLQSAKQQLQESTDKAAIAFATTTSTAAEDDKDYVKAYEVLAELTPTQRKAVAERMDSLKDPYIKAATERARELDRLNNPIKGVGNERGVQVAYDLLSRCYTLTNDPNMEDRMRALGDRLGDYYLQRAKYYLARPEGTGANVGWAYLQEALLYNHTDAAVVRDEMTVAAPIHQLRSRLSLRVTFGDQTSGRDAVNFSRQLVDSLVGGLDSSGPNIKVVRPTEETKVQPNFLLVGNVLQHVVEDPVQRTAKPSKYRSGEQDQVSADWAAADREYQAASLTLETERRVLEGAMAGGKKNRIAEAQRQTDEAQKKVLETQEKRDALPHFRHVSTEQPYTYTEATHLLKATVELGFVIQDTSDRVIVPNVTIPRTEEQTYVVLENVKPDDIMGVRPQGEVPTPTRFLEKVENDARDLLLAQAKEKVIGLPPLILQTADRKVAESDTDGAAELYMLYLNSTGPEPTAERKKAQNFLQDTYNFKGYGDPPKS
jgi:tetratricopeptide (TPR) repeat protein